MIFCGTRIKTEPAAEMAKRQKKDLLVVTKEMWPCEEAAIANQNTVIKLHNQGVALSTLPTLDMSFLSRLNIKMNPKFGVFPISSFKCRLDIELKSGGVFDSLSCKLPRLIGDGYRLGMKKKKLRSRNVDYALVSCFVGLIPQEVKEKITALGDAKIASYIVAETSWEESELPKPDPLLIAVHGDKVYLVAVFNASIEENYVAKEFSTDA